MRTGGGREAGPEGGDALLVSESKAETQREREEILGCSSAGSKKESKLETLGGS